MHKKCYRIPKSNKKYWSSKIQRNIGRDTEHCRDLKKSGWRVFKLWECEISDKKIGLLKNKISAPAGR
jgi:DNA mismatch endonuclease (patch repair protein)